MQPRPWLGGLILAHYAFLVALKAHDGLLQELWWNSHVTLLLAGVGLLLGRTLLVTTAITACALGHLGWMTDAAIGLTTGTFPLGMAHYLLETGPLTCS